MYLHKVYIENIRNIREFTFELKPEECAGWHVLIGDNGSGKSSILRAMALGLIGKTRATVLFDSLKDWITHGEEKAVIKLNLLGNPDEDKLHGKGRAGELRDIKGWLELVQENNGNPFSITEHPKKLNDKTDVIWRGLWGSAEGWFSVGYGPFRRFSGGNLEKERSLKTNPRLAAHASLFGEDVALSEISYWLGDLYTEHLEHKLSLPDSTAKTLLDQIHLFVNQDDFLPHSTRLKNISSKVVTFIDGNKNEILIDDLSDGYRSILSLTLELIRQLRASYPNQALFSEDFTQVIPSGVVLVDEIDAHLHPTWQKEIGFWFRKHFPNLQFIVSTHSPLVCQAAQQGSVWKLPSPSSDEIAYRVQGTELNRLLYGNILESFSTELFGISTTRSDESQKKLERLAELNIKEVFSGLTDLERDEQAVLRSTLPTSAGEGIPE